MYVFGTVLCQRSICRSGLAGEQTTTGRAIIYLGSTERSYRAGWGGGATFLFSQSKHTITVTRDNICNYLEDTCTSDVVNM